MTRETKALNELMHEIRAAFRSDEDLMRWLFAYRRGLMTLGELLKLASDSMRKD